MASELLEFEDDDDHGAATTPPSARGGSQTPADAPDTPSPLPSQVSGSGQIMAGKKRFSNEFIDLKSKDPKTDKKPVLTLGES